MIDIGYAICYVMTIVFAVFSIVYAVSLCANYKNLKFAIGVIDASVHFLEANRKIYFSALLFNTMNIMIISIWMVCSFSIYS